LLHKKSTQVRENSEEPSLLFSILDGHISTSIASTTSQQSAVFCLWTLWNSSLLCPERIFPKIKLFLYLRLDIANVC